MYAVVKKKKRIVKQLEYDKTVKKCLKTLFILF